LCGEGFSLSSPSAITTVWLQPGEPNRLPVDLLRPFDADKMKAWKVDKGVGNVKNDPPNLLTSDNVGEMPKPLTEAEIRRREDMDDLGLINAMIELKERGLERKNKKNEPKPEDPNLRFNFQ
jgi:hypothetical protein